MPDFNCDACRDYGGFEVRDGQSHTFLWELCPYCNPKADDYPLDPATIGERPCADYRARTGRWMNADGEPLDD